MIDPTTARRMLSLLDLTSLNDDDSEATSAALCNRAVTAFGPVAAVCVWPRFVPLCQEALAGKAVRVATVANFPHGQGSLERVLVETSAAIASGADEIDLVFPYHAWLAGEKDLAAAIIGACRDLCGDTIRLKVILEAGRLKTAANIAGVSLAAIEAGADFLKTSTGKIEVSATLPAATVMLSAIKQVGRPVGFKAAGGIRTPEDAIEYLTLAEGIMGSGWVRPETFRFGASALLDNLLAALGRVDGTPSPPN